MLPYIVGYLVIGLIIALVAEYQLAQAKKNPAWEMLSSMMPEITVGQRIINAFLTVLIWPIILIKRA